MNESPPEPTATTPAPRQGLLGGDFLAGDEPAVRLPVFEGPLDLLLFLIRKNEIDLYDIPIETVTRQYLDALRAMERLNLEVAGDFFVMASTLMYLKSRILLPKEKRPREEEAAEDGPDPRWELVQQLIEYRKFRQAAEELDELIVNEQERLPRLAREKDAIEEERPIEPVDHLRLWNVFNQVLRRLADRIVVGEIEDEPVTVADRMEYILERSRHEPSFRFSSLFDEKVSLFTFATTFLAILELTRLARLRLRQEAAFADITCEVVVPAPGSALPDLSPYPDEG